MTGLISRGMATIATALFALAAVVVGPMSSAGAQSGYPFSPGYIQFPTDPFVDAWGQCDAPFPAMSPAAPIGTVTLTRNNAGCWMTGTDGAVYAYGSARSYGSMAGKALAAPVVGMAPTNGDGGYWLVGSDGGVFSFGDAHFHGSTGGKTLAAPVVGMATDPATGGYWLVAADGGVFSFDAPFFGSMGGKKLQAPVVGIVAVPGGGGYWLVAADGGVFSFGNAPFHGSVGGRRLAAPVTAMAADPATGGYWLVAADGGVFSFDAPFFGSAATPFGLPPNPIVSIAATSSGRGYVLLPTGLPVEPGVAGRSGFALAQREWADDANLACYLETSPLIQGAQYLLIGEGSDGGNVSGYQAAINDFEDLSTLPGMDRTSAQNARAFADTTGLNAFFGTNAQGPCS